MHITYKLLKDAVLSRDALLTHAAEISMETTGARLDFPRTKQDLTRLRTAYRVFSSPRAPASAGGKWIGDNFHLLETTLKEIGAGAYQHLPRTAGGTPRVYVAAAELVGHTQGRLDQGLIVDFFNACQHDSAFTMEEVRAIKLTLLTALVKLCSLEAVRCVYAAEAEQKARQDAQEYVKDKDFRKLSLKNPYYVARLSSELEGELLSVLEGRLELGGASAAALTRAAHREKVKSAMILENAITAIRTVNRLDWSELFCSLSVVERLLCQDNVYERMDGASREYYRERVAAMAKRAGVSQTAVAKMALLLKQNEKGGGDHVGWYLIRGGKNQLYAALGAREERETSFGAFLGALLSFTAVLLLPVIGRGWWSVCVPGAVCAFTVAFLLFRRLWPTKRRMLPRLDFEKGIPDSARTLVVIPGLLNSEKNAVELVDSLAAHHLATRKDNVFYALLGDLAPANRPTLETDEGILAAAKARCEELNARYGHRFQVLTRPRTLDRDGSWCGYERKRGALLQLCEVILTGADHFDGKPPAGICYVLTLDADAVLQPEGATLLIGAMAHPLNRLEYGGYAVIAPRMETTASSAAASPFARLFGSPCGMDAYSQENGEMYHDLFGQGNYCGKGIFDVAQFYQAVKALPENTVLSHDLLEGCLARTGYAGGVAVFDDVPWDYFSYSARSHRWIRGDWQNLPFVFKKGLSGLDRFKMLDNLRRSMVEPAVLGLFFVAPFVPGGGYWVLLGLMSMFGDLILDFFSAIVTANDASLKVRDALHSLRYAALRGLFMLVMLPHTAFVAFDGAIRAVYRVFISHKKTLEWTTAADGAKAKGVANAYKRMWLSPVCGVAAAVLVHNVPMVLLGLLWLLSPIWAVRVSKRLEREELTGECRKTALDGARGAWKYFRDFVTAEHNFLPPDNVQLDFDRASSPRTSPTNIGMGITAPYAAYKLGFIDQKEAAERTAQVVKALEKLEKLNGQPYNWYDTRTLRVLEPRFVSSVDNGNLAACMITAREGLRELEGGQDTARRLDALLLAMNLGDFYDPASRLFYVGLDGNGPNAAHYDLMASESLILSFCAIAKGDVPAAHWRALSRALTTIEGKRLLVSWNGTMFEYLMPRLFFEYQSQTLLYESALSAVAAQQRHCVELEEYGLGGCAWGVSESGYYAFDLGMNYKYRAFGVPGAGIKAVLEDKVLAPYATMLALMVKPKAACANLETLKELGAWGDYGFYEAIDFTYSRVRGKHQVVKSYMAHHQGMSLLAVCNALCSEAIARTFAKADQVKSCMLLLSERAPERSLVIRDYKRALPPPVKPVFVEKDVSVKTSRFGKVKCGLFGDAIQLAVFSDGRSRAEYKGYRLYKSSLDPLEHKGIRLTAAWDQTQIDLCDADAVIDAGCVSFFREEGPIKTKVEVCAPLEAGEVRRIELVNKGSGPVAVKLEAYGEVSLMRGEEEDHPAFRKLFVECAWGEGRLCFRRRDVGLDMAVQWMGGGSMGNERLSVQGRGWQLPFMEKQVLGGDMVLTPSPVEPCFGFSQSVNLGPGEKAVFGLAIMAGEEACSAADDYIREFAYERALAASRTWAEVRQGELSAQLVRDYEACAGALIGGRGYGPARLEAARRTKGIEALWSMGISGDKPIVAAIAQEENDVEQARQAAGFAKYMGLNGFEVELVLVAPEEGYLRPVYDALCAISATVSSSRVLNRDQANLDALEVWAGLVWGKGEVAQWLEQPCALRLKELPAANCALALERPRLEHFNGIGGFCGDDYVIYLEPGKQTPLPWCNLLTSDSFGSVISESGGGWTWTGNSREGKVTRWSNDPVKDGQSELMLLRDEENGRCSSPMPRPLPDGAYCVTHGKGYSLFESGGQSVYQSVTVFVDRKKRVKTYLVKLRNPMGRQRRFRVFFMAAWDMGARTEDRTCEFAGEGLVCRGYGGWGYVSAPGQQLEWTTSRRKFYEGLKTGRLEGEGGGADCCGAFSFAVGLSPLEEREFTVVVGFEEELDVAKTMMACWDEVRARASLEEVRDTWRRRLGKLRIKTENPAFDRLFNSILPYQIWTARLEGRAGFYQASGAYGFRDQLQDVLGLLITAPERAGRQLLLAAAHQFLAGDVQHWWHPPYRGVRTRISDDMLFLPYVAARYVKATGDYAILDREVAYLEDMPLAEDQKDVYGEAVPSQVSETLYMHCLRAIGRAFRLGSHGLPLMGTGDWNDGMDQVGGESVWLGWFLKAVMGDMAELCQKRGEAEVAKRLRTGAKTLLAALEKEGWDGKWYSRAFFENGFRLGSEKNAECRIDSISQSWAVLGGGPTKRARQAMEQVDKLLVDRNHGIIKLLDPPLSLQLPVAGYIQQYVPGVRENGGQYTHAAAWVILAFIRLGDLNKAYELFEMINPIRHGDNPLVTRRYMGEPYAMAGDVYAGANPGRVGWSWYTGSAAWLYTAALEFLGVQQREGTLTFSSAAAEVIGAYTVTADGAALEATAAEPT